MPKIIKNGAPKIVAQANIGALVTFPVIIESKSGKTEKVFEKFVRPPGTRVIALRERNIFLQKEIRLEIDSQFDWRLPGGKVFDSFDEYKSYIDTEIPEKIILQAGRKELQEEAGMDSPDMETYKKSSCGALVEWDLYYIVAKNTTIFNKENDEGEEIIEGKWFSFDEVILMCKNGEIQEDRTVSALYQFISKTQ